jgi:DNA-binding NtrC family response regulator
VPVDVRVLSATHGDLGARSRAGNFRLDLYARLRLWEIRVPALRDRRVDILGWLERLRELWYARRRSRPEVALSLDADVVERLLLHEFSDNLRGLDRLVHRLAAIGNGDVAAALQAEAHGAPSIPSTSSPGRPMPRDDAPPPVAAKRARRTRPSRSELEQVLADNGGSVRAAARHFGLDRRQLYRWLEHYGMRGKE